MSQLSKASKNKIIELLESSLELYKGKKFQECLKKYEEVLGIIAPTDNIAIKGVLFALISQVHIKIVENEATRTHTAEEEDLLKILKLTNQLTKTQQIEDTEIGMPKSPINSGQIDLPKLPMNSGQIEDPPVGIIRKLIKIFGN